MDSSAWKHAGLPSFTARPQALRAEFDPRVQYPAKLSTHPCEQSVLPPKVSMESQRIRTLAPQQGSAYKHALKDPAWSTSCMRALKGPNPRQRPNSLLSQPEGRRFESGCSRTLLPTKEKRVCFTYAEHGLHCSTGFGARMGSWCKRAGTGDVLVFLLTSAAEALALCHYFAVH
eukprot:1161592-Pelagomonas_calceolata.AAC.11